MACFSFPKSFYNRINKAIRNFWWKGDLIHKGILWANWASMCHSKLFGGLGFRDFSAFNQAMLAKQGWRLLSNPHSYWAQIFKGLYFPHSTFLYASRGAKASWAWNSLLEGRALLSEGLRWQVQDGKSIRFWEDKWLLMGNFQLSSPKPPHCSINLVSDAIDPVHKQW